MHRIGRISLAETSYLNNLLRCHQYRGAYEMAYKK